MSFEVAKMAFEILSAKNHKKENTSTCSEIKSCEELIPSVCLGDFVRALIIHSNTSKAAREKTMIRLENPRKKVLRVISDRGVALF